jgi:hypothetical protein
VGAGDKASNKIDDLGGNAKEALGKVTGDKDTENKGNVDQAKSSPSGCRREDQGRVQELGANLLLLGPSSCLVAGRTPRHVRAPL